MAHILIHKPVCEEYETMRIRVWYSWTSKLIPKIYKEINYKRRETWFRYYAWPKCIKLVKYLIGKSTLGRPRLKWEDYVKKYVKAIDPKINLWGRGKQKTEKKEDNLFYGVVLKTGNKKKSNRLGWITFC